MRRFFLSSPLFEDLAKVSSPSQGFLSPPLFGGQLLAREKVHPMPTLRRSGNLRKVNGMFCIAKVFLSSPLFGDLGKVGFRIFSTD